MIQTIDMFDTKMAPHTALQAVTERRALRASAPSRVGATFGPSVDVAPAAEIAAEVPDRTLEAVARSFHAEATHYGFGMGDIVRFVNVLLETAMNDGQVRPGATAPTRPAEGPRDRGTLPLVSQRLAIRALGPCRDRAVIARWLDDPSGRHFLLSRAAGHRLTPDALWETDTHRCGMVTDRDDRPLGLVAFLNHDPDARRAELRKLIGEPSQRGRGLGKEATRLWIAYGVQALGLKKIVLNTLETNLRNIRINEELGFQVEGVFRNEVFFDGTWHDVIRMGCLVG